MTLVCPKCGDELQIQLGKMGRSAELKAAEEAAGVKLDLDALETPGAPTPAREGFIDRFVSTFRTT